MCFFVVRDSGIGLFQNIATQFGLPNENAGVGELLKGKATTMAERHSGEGIFFTSRAGDIVDHLCLGNYWGSSGLIPLIYPGTLGTFHTGLTEVEVESQRVYSGRTQHLRRKDLQLLHVLRAESRSLRNCDNGLRNNRVKTEFAH